MALPANIRVGRKGLPVTTTLAFYEHQLTTIVKSHITLTLGFNHKTLGVNGTARF